MRYFLVDRQRARRGLLLAALALTLFTAGVFYRLSTVPATATFGQPTYQGSPQHKEVALTVNVFWGEEYVPKMLDVFKEQGVKATFFMGGTWVKQFPDLTRSIYSQGHEIGNHSYSHPHVDNLSKHSNIKEIQKNEALIYKVLGVRPTLYAPPYGERGPGVLQAAQEAGYRTILWSVDTLDWQRPGPQVIVQRVLGKIHNGAIILMHPTDPTVKALPQIIEGLKKEGYQFVTISQLLEKLQQEEESTSEGLTF